MEAIRTERLVIRPFEATDLDDFLGYHSHPEVRRHLPGPARTPGEAAAYLTMQSTLADDARNAWHDWAVEHVTDQRVIGNIGVYLPESNPLEGNVGFQFDPPHHGHGYAREAACGLPAHLFGTLALRTVTASCDEANTRSARLLLALGMTELLSPREGQRSFELRRVPERDSDLR